MASRGLWSIAIGLAVPLACAGASTDQRIDELNRRVAQLEARLAPEAGAAGEGDAAVISAAMSDASVSDAAKSQAQTKEWGVDRMPVDCMQLATPHCQRAVAAASKRATGDGGFQWVKTEPLPAADSTPEGRECLRQARQACEKRRAAAERDVELLKWLNAQLESDQLDRAYAGGKALHG
jgi:hypothetical protein